MKIGFATNDWNPGMKDADGHPVIGGAGHYRCRLPAKYLQALGFETVVGRLVGRKSFARLSVKTWDETLHDDLDLIVLQRYQLAELVDYVPAAVAAGQVVVQDVDDWFWGLDPKNSAFRGSHPGTNPDSNVNHYRAILAASSAVTVSTPYLAERLRARAGMPPVHVVRNAVETSAFAQVAADNLARHENPDQARRARVGWIGATSWRSGDLETLRGILGPFLARNDLAFYHGGHHAAVGVEKADDLLGLDPLTEVETRPMAPIEEYPDLFAGLDVGLVPLRDAPFNRAKSWIKGLEYAAAAVPFVAADLPEYHDLRATWGIGSTARRPRDWAGRLAPLLDPEERARVAVSNLEAVRAHHDVEARARDWAAAYMAILNAG